MPTERMGPPPGALPPMRMTASWLGPNGPAAYRSYAVGGQTLVSRRRPTTEPRERSMRQATTLPAPQRTCSRGDCATLFVSLELSRSTWVATALAPGSSKMSKYTLVGGDGHKLLDSSAENHRQEESNNLTASGGKQVDDLLDGFIGAVVGGFEFAGRLVSDVGAAMEAAVGERAAEPLVEEQEEQRHLDAFGCEAIGVAGAIALQKDVALELVQVVAELVRG